MSLRQLHSTSYWSYVLLLFFYFIFLGFIYIFRQIIGCKVHRISPFQDEGGKVGSQIWLFSVTQIFLHREVRVWGFNLTFLLQCYFPPTRKDKIYSDSPKNPYANGSREYKIGKSVSHRFSACVDQLSIFCVSPSPMMGTFLWWANLDLPFPPQKKKMV